MGNLIFKILFFSVLLTMAATASAQSDAVIPEVPEQQDISLLKNKLEQVRSTSEALNNLIAPTKDFTEIIGSDIFSNDLYIRMNEKIDQKFYHTKFKVLSVDAPIIYKLFT